MLFYVTKKRVGFALGVVFTCFFPQHQVQAAEPVVIIQPPTPLDVKQLKAVIFNNDPLLINFSLSRTVGQILTTGGKENTEDNRRKFIRTLLDSFGQTSFKNRNVVIPLTQRPTEKALLAGDLLNPENVVDGMRPVAITNRLDLMPADGTHCGEQRIIYEKGDGSNFADRMTLIFEATLENPKPSLGAAGCLPIAKFWNDLSAQNLPDTEIRVKLEDFFYKGIVSSTVKITPPVHFLHYGNPFGAVRINTFVNTDTVFVDWILRQYKTAIFPNVPFVKLATVPVENNPWRQIYEPVLGNEPQALQDRMTQCQKDIHTKNLKDVTSLELRTGKNGPNVTDLALISELGVTIRAGCNGVESNATDRDAASAPPSPFFDNNFPLEVKLDDALRAQENQMPYPLRTEQIMERINSQSCAGCHELTTGFPIADGVSWPDSLGFVHIDETGRLSPLLTDHFLPARFKRLKDFLKTPLSSSQAEATVANVEAVKTLQQQILKQVLTADKEATLVQDQRMADSQKEGALVKIRPTH